MSYFYFLSLVVTHLSCDDLLFLFITATTANYLFSLSLQLPTCQADDDCRVISYSREAVFYDEKCKCEQGHCPSNLGRAYTKWPGKKGIAYLFRCSS